MQCIYDWKSALRTDLVHLPESLNDEVLIVHTHGDAANLKTLRSVSFAAADLSFNFGWRD